MAPMCITTSEAYLSKTIVYAGEVLRQGKPVHVMGYQNSVQAEGGGPNAMLLPIPAASPLGPENLVDLRGYRGVLKDYQEAVKRMKPVPRSFTKGGPAGAASASFQVFESGAYTVALATSAAGIGKALQEVPERKRPKISVSFLLKLGTLYPKWSFALCCFNNGDMQAATTDPVVWWYEPMDPSKLFAPAIDAHDGNPPKAGQVSRDHTLVFGSYQAESLRPNPWLQERLNKAGDASWLFTSAIVGLDVNEMTPNGDFTFSIADIMNHRVPGYGPRIAIEAPEHL